MATITINWADFDIEISGSEEFVSNEIEAFREVILEKLSGSEYRVHLQDEAVPDSSANTVVSQHSSEGGRRSGNGQGSYPHVYSIEDTEVTLLLNEIPGTSNREQTVNLAVLYLYGKTFAGIEEVSADELRDIAKEYGVFDASNFSGNLKSDKRVLHITKQSSHTYTIKLTRPGRERAKEVIRQLENGDKSS